MRCDRLAKDQLAEITMFQISEVQESPAFNGRRSFLILRGQCCDGFFVFLNTVLSDAQRIQIHPVCRFQLFASAGVDAG
jgi:hypothetical protein